MPLSTAALSLPGLSGEKIHLRPVQEGDLPRIGEWKRDPELASLILAQPSDPSDEALQAWLTGNNQDRNQVLLGIALNDSPAELIGLVRLMFINWTNRSAEFGIYIGDKAMWGRQLGREAAELALEHAFGQMNLHRVYLKVGEGNTAARKLYRSLGFREEAKLREHFQQGEGFINVVCMGRLRHDERP